MGWRNLVRFQGQNDFWKLGLPIVGVGRREKRVWSERRGREWAKQMDPRRAFRSETGGKPTGNLEKQTEVGDPFIPNNNFWVFV